MEDDRFFKRGPDGVQALNQQNLTGKQRFRLRDVLRYNLKTVRACLLKETFQQIWDYDSPVWAGKFLDVGAARSCAPASNP